jgi:lysophospholipase L1-like esterase
MGFSSPKKGSNPIKQIPAARGGLVSCAGYTAISTDYGLFNHHNDQRHYFNLEQSTRIRQNGSIVSIQLYISSLTGISNLFFYVWRYNGSTYDQVGKEDIRSKLTEATTNTVVLTTPIQVREGDFVGVGGTGTDSTYRPYTVVAVSSGGLFYCTSEAPAVTGMDWGAKTASNNIIPIYCFMAPPQIVFIGDSITAGHPAHYSFIEATETTSLGSYIAYYLGAKLGATYQNMGVGGQTSTQILARFTTDVVNLKPRIAVINCGVNDISGGSISLATYTSNMASMIKSCIDNDIVPVILAILPWTSGTDSQMNTRDIWNGALKNLVAGYPQAIYVDAGKYVGKSNSAGPSGNTWDIIGGYNSDGVHFTAAGYQAIAQAIYDALP